MLAAYFGHHKCASNWIATIMEDLAEQQGWETLLLYDYVSWPGYLSLGDRVRAEGQNLLMYTNARQADVDSLPELAGFHVIRDPRDMIVSGYFSHLYSHPEEEWPKLQVHRLRLKELDLNEGLFLEIEWSAQFIDFMLEWRYDQPGILELRMEEMTADPMGSWSDILRHLGVTDLPDGYLADVLDRFSFERMSGGRSRGEEDQRHHYRRGIPGDWRNYLTSEHLAAIRDRYGDFEERLGYQ